MRVVAGSQKHLAGFACSTALLLLVSLLAGTPGYAHEKLKVGDIPPQRLGWSTKLSDYRGKIVVISFWATIPHMAIVGRDGRVAAIHLGYSESEIPTLIQEINSLGAQPAGAAAPQHASN